MTNIDELILRLRILRDMLSGINIPASETCDEAATALSSLKQEIEGLRAIIENPPKHRFWRPGEPDCPREIKAGNGELHTLRCKICGMDNPFDDFCRAALKTERE